MAAPALRAQDLIISEILAVNASGITDEDGERSDWIEIYNPTDRTINLAGWSLSDEFTVPLKYVLPDRDLEPGRFLLVFASGKNRTSPTGELHASFRLEEDGEFLGLFDPRRNLVSAFAPGYPIQISDASYGVSTDATLEEVVAIGAAARVHIPADDSLGATWRDVDFDDAAWSAGTTAVGYGGRPPESDLIGADVSAMRSENGSVYVRIPFDVADASLPNVMRMFVQYDDGFAAYINGQLVASDHIPDPLEFDSNANAVHSASVVEKFDLSSHLGALRTGRNVLAVQVLNRPASSSDLYFLPRIELISVGEVRPDTLLYFDEPSPGEPNLRGFVDIALPPIFSHESGAFTEAPSIELTTEIEGATIRYTTDGSTPDASSAAYEAPIEITGITRLTARVFHPELLPSEPATETYMLLHPNVQDFSSNLPIVAVTNFGQRLTSGSPCDGAYNPAHLMLFMPDEQGKARLTDPASFSDSCGVRKRGSSTCGRSKFSFNVEFRDENENDKNVRLIEDFPADSDYVMYGPYNFDRGLMRNPIAYWMSRQIGRWAANTRFVECFFHQSTAPLGADAVNGQVFRSQSYHGVYVLMEKNKRHPDKIPVERLTASDNTEPNVAGGYIMRRDRVGQGEVSFSAGGYSSLVFVYPKQPTPAQRAWITNYVNRAISSLSPQIGSQEDSTLIDVGQFLDHHILCWYPKNVDAFRLSGYFHKTRDGLLAMGPAWDYDRTMGCSDDSRAADPLGWHNNNSGDGGTRYFEAGGLGSWYSHLFQNRPPQGNNPWEIAYRSRWREIRREALTNEQIAGQVDAWGDLLETKGDDGLSPADRNFAKWPGSRPRFGGFPGEVAHLKNWLTRRADWIDQQFIATPTFNHPGGVVEPGLQVEISIDSPAPIYYTVDGSDPRGAGGPSEAAVEYTGPITINENSRIIARSFEGGSLWSAAVERTFVVDVIPLAVTEIMYNPPSEPDTGFSTSSYEFLELQNVGSEPLDLTGMQVLSPPSRFVFEFDSGSVKELAPGEFVVLARSIEAFESRYGEGINVAGEYDGILSNTSQEIQIIGPIGDVHLSFTYDDGWAPETDGDGYSLVIDDSSKPLSTWTDPSSWRASLEILGSPGRSDSEATEGSQIAGDINQDARLNTTDVVAMLRNLFRGSGRLPCETVEGNDALLDVNGDSSFNVSDPIFALAYLFQRGNPPVLGTSCTPILGCPDVCAED